MARYKEIQDIEEKNAKAQEEASISYAFTKKVNKLRPYQLFKYILEVNNKVHVSSYLLIANKKNWSSIENYIFDKSWNEKNQKLKLHLMETVFKKAETYFESYTNLQVFKNIVQLYDQRLRDIETWKPKSINTEKLNIDLLNHLFAKYPVPKFLATEFSDTVRIENSLLYLHIGAGKAIKKFELIPKMIISNKAYHHIQTTPDDLTFNEAFRRAQILSMGGDENIFRTLMGSKIGRYTAGGFKEDDFWVTVIKFFIDNRMIDPVKVQEIIDYIDDQKFNKRMRPGTGLPPIAAQPNFTMKGRTPQSLINQSDAWHFESALIAKQKKNAGVWDPVNIPDYNFTNGNNQYDIKQLTSTKELVDEGKRMSHCVGSYASSCMNKRCSIFSFRVTNLKDGVYNESKITMEITNRTIVQARAKYNHKPHPYYMEIVTDWARKNSLGISKWV